MNKKILSLYDRISALVDQARHAVVKNINLAIVYTYDEIGRMIVEDEQRGDVRADYGEGVLKDLSKRLSSRFGKGYSVDNLQNMRTFFLTYGKYETLSRKSGGGTRRIPPKRDFNLSWSHYVALMRIQDAEERRFYEIECATNDWSLREFQRQFDSGLYERLALSRDKEGVRALAKRGHIIEKPEDLIKDPYILEFTGLPELARYSESELEQSIIDRIEHFLLELGKGFAFVGRQVRFTFDEKHFRVDLVFYNRLLRCFVLIDLKIGDLSHQDLGQMQMYVNYYDRFVKLPNENKSIGIVLCKSKSKTLVEITLPEDNNTIFASQYRTVLPHKAELKRLLKDKP